MLLNSVLVVEPIGMVGKVAYSASRFGSNNHTC